VSEVRALLDANRPVKPWETAVRGGNSSGSLATRLATEAAIAAWKGQPATPRLFPPDLLKPARQR
jgi:hypothetical protein